MWACGGPQHAGRARQGAVRAGRAFAFKSAAVAACAFCSCCTPTHISSAVRSMSLPSRSLSATAALLGSERTNSNSPPAGSIAADLRQPRGR